MKKIVFFAIILHNWVVVAQTRNEHRGRVGINTVTPKASLEISKHTGISETSPQGILFPKLTNSERNKFEKTEVGTLIYNIDNKCIEMYMGVVGGIHQWSCLPDMNSTKQQNVAIVPMGFEGSYVGGVALGTTNKVNFKIINNSFSPITNIDFSTAVSISNGSADINILPNQNNRISLASGQEVILSYKMSGTPENGILTANFDRLNLQSSQQTTVGMGSATIASQNTIITNVSLTYKGFDVQGKINNGTNQLTVKIPYMNGQGSYNSVSSAVTTNPNTGHNGDVNTLTLTIPEGNFNGDGELVGTINVSGMDTEYLIKLLQPEETITFAEFPITINGNQYNVILQATGGVPDKMFGEKTNNKYEHQFVYVPVNVPGAGIWLNNNLGADYSNVDSPDFSPVTQAGGDSKDPNIIKRDYKAYGSFFQWGREADGHELTNWLSATQYTRRYSTISYIGSTNLTVYNEPCPNGYHTPTYQELMQLQENLTGVQANFDQNTYSSAFWNDLILRLPAVGNVGLNGLTRAGSMGRYRSKSLVNNRNPYLWFSSRDSDIASGSPRADLFVIRCLKN